MAFITRNLDGVRCWIYDSPISGKALDVDPKIIELLGIPLPAPGEIIEWPLPAPGEIIEWPLSAQVSAPPEPTVIEKTCNTCKWDHRICPQGPEKDAHCAPCHAYSNWEPRSESPQSEKKDCTSCGHFAKTKQCALGLEEGLECYGKGTFRSWIPIENLETGKKFDEEFNASYFLLTGAKLLKERGRHYDSGQERSMKKAVEVFNTLTGYSVTETQGWLFMQCVKLVRQQTAKGFHQDSYEDDIAYAALKAESAAKEGEK